MEFNWNLGSFSALSGVLLIVAGKWGMSTSLNCCQLGIEKIPPADSEVKLKNYGVFISIFLPHWNDDEISSMGIEFEQSIPEHKWVDKLIWSFLQYSKVIFNWLDIFPSLESITFSLVDQLQPHFPFRFFNSRKSQRSCRLRESIHGWSHDNESNFPK